MNLPDKLISKVRNAAQESYEEYSKEFSALEPKQLFKTAYIHGYNCTYNIYDVAEEKVDL